MAIILKLVGVCFCCLAIRGHPAQRRGGQKGLRVDPFACGHRAAASLHSKGQKYNPYSMCRQFIQAEEQPVIFLSCLFLQIVKIVRGKQMGIVVHFALRFCLIQKRISPSLGVQIHLLLNGVLKVELAFSRQLLDGEGRC